MSFTDAQVTRALQEFYGDVSSTDFDRDAEDSMRRALEAAEELRPVAIPSPVPVTYASEDRRPHSRACGYRQHSHGTGCDPNCPTCHGSATEALNAPQPPTAPETAAKIYGIPTEDRSLADDEPPTYRERSTLRRADAALAQDLATEPETLSAVEKRGYHASVCEGEHDENGECI